jgi:hypothetical protein
MSKRMLSMSVAALLAAGAAFADAASTAASAALLYGALAIRKAAGTEAVPVWYREWGWSYGPAYVEDEEMEPRYYRRYYYYDAYDRDPAFAPPRYRPPAYHDIDADYCASRYRSWDPETGTFLGYDGYRHPCR